MSETRLPDGSFVQPVGLLLALCGSEKEDRQNSVQQ